MGRLETAVTNRILIKLARARIKAIKIHGSVFMEAGTPDVFACIKGRLWVIEVKNDEGEPTKLQLHRLKEWYEAGAACCLVRDADELIQYITRGKPNWKPTDSGSTPEIDSM